MIEEHEINSSLIYVTSRACRDCPFYPDRHPQLRQDLMRRITKENYQKEYILECLVATIGEMQGKPIPQWTICFSFFYLYAQENPYLKRAVEEGRIRYIDISDWPTLAETHYSIYGPGYIRTDAHFRRNVYTTPVEKEKE